MYVHVTSAIWPPHLTYIGNPAQSHDFSSLMFYHKLVFWGNEIHNIGLQIDDTIYGLNSATARSRIGFY